jgi:hypothetical protein
MSAAKEASENHQPVRRIAKPSSMAENANTALALRSNTSTS